jgi:Zn-dependent protease/CBS domain-containing protein
VNESVRLGRVAGIPIGANWSLFAIAALLTWALADATLPAAAPGYGWAAYTVTALVVVAFFFVGLLAHELAHSVVAVGRGVPVERITLWLFGGVSQLRGDAPSPGAEFRITIVGPLTSLAVAAVFGGVATVFVLLQGPALAVAGAAWLAGINALLAFFNLLPGAPLDGGRVLHAAVWARTGSHERATEVATRSGQWVGYGLIALGILAVLGGDLFAVWFLLIGWFLVAAARAEATHELLRDALEPLRVRDVMTPDPVVAPDDVALQDLIDGWFLQRGCSAFPLRGRDGHVDALVTLSGLRRHRGNGALTARDVADDVATVARVSPDDSVATLLEQIQAAHGGDGRALVFEGERLVGIVSPTDLRRALDLAALRTPSPRRGASGDAPAGVAT